MVFIFIISDLCYIDIMFMLHSYVIHIDTPLLPYIIYFI